MKKIIFPIVIVVLLIIISLNILSIYNISVFKMRIFKIGSGSMEPYLKVNSLIVVKESDDYKVGDVITYNDEIGYVTHRIIDIKDNEIIAKGDANNTQDDPITKDKVVGKVILRISLFSAINYAISRPIIWVSILIIGGVIIYLIPEKKK